MQAKNIAKLYIKSFGALESLSFNFWNYAQYKLIEFENIMKDFIIGEALFEKDIMIVDLIFKDTDDENFIRHTYDNLSLVLCFCNLEMKWNGITLTEKDLEED